MPSDVFSLLLKAKQKLRAEDSVSVDDVVSTFLPFLSAIASAKKRPTADTSAVLSSALFDYIRTESRAVNVKKALATMKETPPAEELGSAKRKRNGKLDQVSDACLRHALSFLSFKERCRIEPTYARLFHLSRTLPLPKEKSMDELLNDGVDDGFFAISMAMFKAKGTTQLSTEDLVHLGSRFDTLSVTGHVADRRDAVRALRQRIVELDIFGTGTMDMETDALLGLTFPCLKRLNCANAPFQSLSRFLQRNLTVSELSVAANDDEDDTRGRMATRGLNVPGPKFWKTISKLTNISQLCFEGFVDYRGDAHFGDISADCDFGHITNLQLMTSTSVAYDFAALRPLLHADLESLSLACAPPFARMKLPSLKQVELYYLPDGYSANFNFDPDLDPFFDALDATQLEACNFVHFPALNVLNSLHKCNARAVCYKLECVDFHTTLAAQTIDDAFRKAVANGITVKEFTLDLSHFEDEDEHLYPEGDYSDLIAFLRGIVRLQNSHWETLRVHIAPDTWRLWEGVLKGFADTLKPFVAM